VLPVTPKRRSSSGFHHLLRPQSAHSTDIEATCAMTGFLPGNAIASPPRLFLICSYNPVF